MPEGESQYQLLMKIDLGADMSMGQGNSYACIHESGPYIELFARGVRAGWALWGNQANEDYTPTWNTYDNNSSIDK